METDWRLWTFDYAEAMGRARKERKPVFLQFHRDKCSGCHKTYETVYPDPIVASELTERFIPLQLPILEDREIRRKYSAVWTPSFYVLDHTGRSFDFFEGFLPVEDFRVQLLLFQAAWLIPKGKYMEATGIMDKGLELFPDNHRAPALLFRKGQAIYLSARDNKAFRAVMQQIRDLYPTSMEARMWPWMEK